ncbi:MAG: MiaB/RimO family radical SAM methylthiotransferase [Candidatus Moranbacteria bacterium]|nr:MiaB/RimO family radical SAM methylthiotransferase [Candidatus Moranbacteria bacterium]
MLKKYFIKTFGCQMNFSDSERITSILKRRGYKSAKSEGEADLIVINACSVRQSAIDRVYAKVHKYYKAKKIILAGCILKEDKKKLAKKVKTFWNPKKYFNCFPIHENKSVVYVPIMTGCNNFCAYCVVPYTRGREISRPASEIIREVKSLVKKGYEEIMLLGQNVNSYRNPRPTLSLRERGLGGEGNFSDLLRKIDTIPGKFRITFMTSHPKDMSDELIDIIAKSGKILKVIHLPVQAGDTQILKKMNRKYTAVYYLNLIKKIRQKIPKVKISTDIIVGFPGETRKQFENTVKLCKKANFIKAYISRYSPRPGTAAAKMADNISRAEKKRRWLVLDKLINKS